MRFRWISLLVFVAAGCGKDAPTVDPEAAALNADAGVADADANADAMEPPMAEEGDFASPSLGRTPAESDEGNYEYDDPDESDEVVEDDEYDEDYEYDEDLDEDDALYEDEEPVVARGLGAS